MGVTPGADGQDYRRLVLDALIERELIRQAAQLAGVTMTPESVEAKMADLRRTASESGSFDEWLASNNWTEEEFREALAAEMLTEAMIANITAGVPFTAEQVRASYIQVDDAALADSLLAQIKDGANFAELAEAHSRDVITAPAGGDLGFFARGSLLVPEVEEAAYGLQPGEVSDVIAVTAADSGRVTYYILEVTGREPERPLDTNLRHQMLQETYNAWLDGQRSNATIVYLVDEG
jgi:parvulin-like peptidyl-prolyl isomerase